MPGPVPAPGAPVWIRRRRWTVEYARIDRSVLRLDVAHGTRRLTFLAPFDRPAFRDRSTRPTRVRPQRARARLAWALANTYPLDLPLAVRDAHVRLWPFQLDAALALGAGTRRILLADDVGLGKTIQTGIAIAEYQRRDPSCRALVIAPPSLVDQWVDELRARFTLDARRVDQDALDADEPAPGIGAPAWSRPGVRVVSSDFLKQPHVMDGLPLTAWDVVVIDEAHTVSGHSQRHEACHELACRSRHVMLLTATPHAGDVASFERLRRLGSLSSDADDLCVLRRTRAEVGLPTARAIRWHRVATPPACARLFDVLKAFERAVLRASRGRPDRAPVLLLSVLRKRAASTVHALDQSLARRLEWLAAPERAYALDWLQPRLSFDEEANDEEDDERAGLVGDSGLAPAHERTWLRRLRVLAEAARSADPKLARVRALLARTTDPVVVFTEFRASLEQLVRHIPVHRSAGQLHGGLDASERRQVLRRFLEGDTSVLIATDVGGMGLNLQGRARWVIDLDLPWNPTRLAQRAGRVDRIGQQRPIHITHIVAAADSHVIVALARRTDAAQHAVGAGMLEDAVPPPALAVAAAVIAGQPLSTDTPDRPLLATCTSWRRRAQAAAVALERRRQWVQQWRGPTLQSARPYTSLRRDRDAGTAYATAVLTIPIIDRAARVIERRAIALSLDAHHSAGAIEAVGRRAVERRVRRLERLVRRVVDRRRSIEHAVAAHLDALRRPEDVQLTLSSQAGHRAFIRTRRAAARADEQLDVSLTALEEAAQLDVGRPVLEVIVAARR